MGLCSIPLIASLLASCAPPAPLATGYVEGDYVLIAPVTTSQITELSVARGDRFDAGDTLVRLDARDAEIALAQAEANLAQAQSQLENLREGKRPEEIRVIEASGASARAQLEEYERNLRRIETLTQRGAATEAQREDAETAVTVARANLAEIEANLAVAQLPARAQEIAAAEAQVRAGTAELDKARWVRDERSLEAPAAGVVSDVLRLTGEIAGPSQPVLSILPDGGVKLRLYVPETQIAEIAPGSELEVRCDGCAGGLRARVSYIADGPEFTPPVIYSLQNRQKLVYLVEARPEGATSLKPGQIVDVDLLDAKK